MARSASRHPTDAELEILKILWDHGPLGIGAICEAVRQHRAVATSTVATVLGVMMDKKQVSRRKSSRGFLWSARLTRDAAADGLTGELVDRLFDGAGHRLVAHLFDSGTLSARDVDRIQDLLDEHRRRAEGDSA
ncbi:MAG: BlaI/MecI/CopY family transcriptional regulator [Phycisphaerales bacterium]|nr:BlaI/MecI/CopY family transcriptional regulator [Phycisphaerales bacterium]